MLRTDVVRAAIGELKRHRIHEQFPAYLRVYQLARRADSAVVAQADWPDFGRYFLVPGGPPNKPQYRPFASVDVRDESRYWKGPNTAGSFAPSSIRSTARFMLSAGGSQFELRENHAEAALEHLLYGERVPAWAVAAFILRNDGFVLDGPGGLEDLIDGFRDVFQFQMARDSTEFDTLFTVDPPLGITEWFVPFIPEEAGE